MFAQNGYYYKYIFFYFVNKDHIHFGQEGNKKGALDAFFCKLIEIKKRFDNIKNYFCSLSQIF